MNRVLVKPDIVADVVAHHLHEVEHVERAGELETNDA
jgi:hypothetical protein